MFKLRGTKYYKVLVIGIIRCLYNEILTIFIYQYVCLICPLIVVNIMEFHSTVVQERGLLVMKPG